jgi:hypothetical protein
MKKLEPYQKEIDEIIAKAYKFKEKKQWEECYQLLNQSVARFPTSDKLVVQLGGYYFDKQNWE